MGPTLKDKIGFSLVKNLNRTTAEKLLNAVGGDESAFFTMSSAQLSALSRLPSKVIGDEIRQQLLLQAEAEERFLLANEINPRYFNDLDYPSRLTNCYDAPVMLYTMGQPCLEARHIVAIVGTRRATPYGIELTRKIVKELSEKLDDLVIVSGLAYGIDIAAHKASLEYKVPTVAVLAHPLNTIYPPEHRGTAATIIKDGGALVTEYATCQDIHKSNFLQRNRIVAGLSDAVIVVESDSRGGALTTAGIALEYDREVFAVPGRITDKYSQGTNALIATDKAHIFTTVDNLLEQMNWSPKKQAGEQLTIEMTLNEHEQKIYDFLSGQNGARINEIMLATGYSATFLKDLLFSMEMRDLVISMAGGRYSAL